MTEEAEPRDRAQIYARVGLQMIYRPGTQTVLAQVTSSALDGVANVCPEGDLNPYYMVQLREDLFLP